MDREFSVTWPSGPLKATMWSVGCVTWLERTWRAILSFQNFSNFCTSFVWLYSNKSVKPISDTSLPSTSLAGSRFDPPDLRPPKINKDFLWHSGWVETLCLLTFQALPPGIKFQNALVVFACGTKIKVKSNSRQQPVQAYSRESRPPWNLSPAIGTQIWPFRLQPKFNPSSSIATRLLYQLSLEIWPF